MFKESIILRNSPVEFVLIGPYMGRDRILLRSDHAGLDLIGLATDIDSIYDLKKSSNDQMSLSSVFGSPRHLNLVRSRDIPTLGTNTEDVRESSLRLVWVGYCSNIDLDRIEEIFSRLRYDIRDAILENTGSDVEMTISSVILRCSLANQNQIRRRIGYRVIFALYGVITLIVIIYILFGPFFDLIRFRLS